MTGGLPAGNYRVCTMTSSSNHQPVLMPVAQRGAQDDCQKFVVGGTGTASTGAASSTSKAATAATGTSTKAALGGIAAPAVTSSGDTSRPFSVNGNTFVDQSDAIQRACSIQDNACSDAVNSGKIAGSTVADCSAQETACNAAGGA